MARRVICPYCQKPAKFWYDSSPVLAQNFGPIWHCDPCQAYVGCHRGRGGRVPLGTLAKFELRRERIRAHRSFDLLWQSRYLTRDGAYAVLADRMGLAPTLCHIAMMDEKQCQRVVQISREIASRRLGAVFTAKGVKFKPVDKPVDGTPKAR